MNVKLQNVFGHTEKGFFLTQNLIGRVGTLKPVLGSSHIFVRTIGSNISIDMWIRSVFPPKNLFVRIFQVSRFFLKNQSADPQKSQFPQLQEQLLISTESHKLVINFYFSFPLTKTTLHWFELVLSGYHILGLSCGYQ
jgi:hypothetical protein